MRSGYGWREQKGSVWKTKVGGIVSLETVKIS